MRRTTRHGLSLLAAALVLRLVQHWVLVTYPPYTGVNGVGETAHGLIGMVVPATIDILSLAAVVAAGVLLAGPRVLAHTREVEDPNS